MKRFDFSLETVLKLREVQEKEWENRQQAVQLLIKELKGQLI